MFTNTKKGSVQVPNHPDYMISTSGEVRYASTGELVHIDCSHNSVRIDGEEFTIHSLMGCAFLGQNICDRYRNRVLFKDGNSSNVNLYNLYVEDTSDLEGEVWAILKEANGRKIKDFYRVSNKGRVKSVAHDAYPSIRLGQGSKPCPEMILSQVTGDHGYKTVWLAAEEKPDVVAQVHRLVAACFCFNADPEHKIYVNHIDGDPANNDWSNLEWCTPSENAQHAIRTGLRGDWKGRKLRYQVKHVETGDIYRSLSDVDRALGRCKGYCSERLECNRDILDINGTVWTLEVFENADQKVHTPGQHCTIEEFPGKEFISLSEASLAIGRWDGYISDSLKRGSVIRNKAGQVMHIHLIGDAPVVSANVAYQEKKAAGLVKPKKERKKSEWKANKVVKCIETGEIFRSMSEADRAMGRKVGYLNDCIAYDRDCFDCNGNKRTFEIIEDTSNLLFEKPEKYKRNRCYFDELPNQELGNLTEASQAIGRSEGYVNDRIYLKKPILSKDNQLMHFHYKDPEKEAKLQSEYYSQVDFNEVPKTGHKKLFQI